MQYKARRPFGYGGQDLEEGQLFDLAGLRNDEKLIRLRFCEKVGRKDETFPCSGCGKFFAEEGSLRRHQARAHSSKAAVAA